MTPPHQDPNSPVPKRRGRHYTIKRSREIEEIRRLRRIVSSMSAKTTPVPSDHCPCHDTPADTSRYISLTFDIDDLHSDAYMRKYPNQTIPGHISISLPNTAVGRDFQSHLQKKQIFENLWPILLRESISFGQEVDRLDGNDNQSGPSHVQGVKKPSKQKNPAFQVHTIGEDGHWNETLDDLPADRSQFKFLSRPSHIAYFPAT